MKLIPAILTLILISPTVLTNRTPAESDFDHFSSAFLKQTQLYSYDNECTLKFPTVHYCLCNQEYSSNNDDENCNESHAGGTFHCNDCSEACNCTPGASNLILYFIFGLAAMFTTFLAILAFYRYKQMREQPGDIIFCLSVSDFILSLHSVIIAIDNWDNGQTNPAGDFCMFYGTISTLSETTSFAYNVCICWFISVSVKNSLKSAKIPRLAFHFVSITGGISYTLVSIIGDHIGMSLFGICSTYTSKSNNYAPILPMVFVVLAIWTYYTVRKYSGECARVNDGKIEFLAYYKRYMTVSSLVYLSTALSYTLMAIWVAYKLDPNATELPDWPWLKIFNALSKISLTLLLSIVRLTDPFVLPHIRKIFGMSARPTKTIKVNLEIPLSPSSNRVITFNQNSEEAGNHDMISSGVGWIAHNLKVQLIYTILSGIMYSIYSSSAKDRSMTYIENEKQKEEELELSEKAREEKEYKINDDVIGANMPSLLKELNTKQYKTLEGKITIYAPKLFRGLMEQDEHFLKVEKSLDLKENYTRIQKAGKAIGGKSGEFFFFSHDNQLIIKTMNDEELLVLLDRLEKYLKYNIDNPDTLIAKIYGIFKFTRLDLEESYNLIIMRNINGYPSDYVERKYDLKGSTFDREVLRSKTLRLDQLRHQEDALKDLDFLKYDRKLFIEEYLKEKLVNVLTKDAMFFRSCGIIDYSLAIYVVDKNRLKWKLSNSNNKSSVEEANKKERSITIVTEPGSDDGQNSLRGLNNSEEISFSQDNKSIDAKDDSKNVKDKLKNNESEGNNVNNEKKINELYSMKSTAGDYYYHLGIIDYLQLYTLNKKMEKYAKKLIKFNPKLDTSSQDPITYSDRFIEFVKKIVI